MKPFIVTPHNRDNAKSVIDRLDPTRNWEMVIREKKSKRSLEQNSRLWDLYTSIAEYLGEDKDHIHQLMGYKFLRYQEEIHGEVVELIKSTTKLNTKEMADYQDAIERWAINLGWYWEEAA
jgi:hypothetical protein